MNENLSPKDLDDMLQSAFSLSNADRLKEAEKVSGELLHIGQEYLQTAGWSPERCQAALRRDPSVKRQEYILLYENLLRGNKEFFDYERYTDFFPLGAGISAMLNAADAYISTGMAYISQDMPKKVRLGHTENDTTEILHGLELTQIALWAYETASVFFKNPRHSYHIRLFYTIGQGCEDVERLDLSKRPFAPIKNVHLTMHLITINLKT